MNIKSLLLGSAAALVAVSGARAADAVVAPEPEPVEYVRVCDVYGAGFYYIPGTETCLKVSGYFRYDIGAGDGVRNNSINGTIVDADGNVTGFNVNRGAWGLPDVLDKKNPLNDDGSANFNDAWYKRSRFQLRVDARSETELGTLRAYLAFNMQYTSGYQNGTFFDEDSGNFVNGPSSAMFFDNVIEHAYLELGGFRVGKTDSYFSTFTDYTINIIHDDNIVPYGPYDTNQISYTYDAGNGFTAGVAVEEGDFGFNESGFAINGVSVSGGNVGNTDVENLYTLDSYAPHVVAGVGYTAGWGGIKAVGGYDSNWENFAAKVRVDAKFSDTFSMFLMGGWADKDDITVTNPVTGATVTFDNAQPNYYGTWGGEWALWGGGSWQFTPKAQLNVQVAYDDFEDFSAIANVDYELVPGLHIQPEIGYLDNFSDANSTAGDLGAAGSGWNGFLRIQRNF
jgi:hypothetical protein